MQKQRPKHLALHQIRLPLPGLVSILHRISGLALFAVIPLLLLMLQYSLSSAVSYAHLMDLFESMPFKLLMFLLLWAFFHHFCAGLRFLAIDLHYIGNLSQARSSSRLVLIASLALTALAGAMLW